MIVLIVIIIPSIISMNIDERGVIPMLKMLMMLSPMFMTSDSEKKMISVWLMRITNCVERSKNSTEDPVADASISVMASALASDVSTPENTAFDACKPPITPSAMTRSALYISS